MSADAWLQAAKTEEERLLAEIAKTALYTQLQAVRAVISVYEGTATPPETGAQQRTNGQASRHSFKTANAFSDTPPAATDASSRASPQ